MTIRSVDDLLHAWVRMPLQVKKRVVNEPMRRYGIHDTPDGTHHVNLIEWTPSVKELITKVVFIGHPSIPRKPEL